MPLCKKMHPSFDTALSRGSLAQPSQLCARDSRNRPPPRASVWTTVPTKVPRSASTLKSAEQPLRARGGLSRLRSCFSAWLGVIRDLDSNARLFQVLLLIRERSHTVGTKRSFYSRNSPQSNGLAFARLPGTPGKVVAAKRDVSGNPDFVGVFVITARAAPCRRCARNDNAERCAIVPRRVGRLWGTRSVDPPALPTHF